MPVTFTSFSIEEFQRLPYTPKDTGGSILWSSMLEIRENSGWKKKGGGSESAVSREKGGWGSRHEG